MYTDPSKSPFLGDWIDTIKGIADKVSNAAIAAREIKAGNAQVTVIPTAQGLQNYAGQLGVTPISTGMVVAGAAALYFLLKKPKRRRR